ncbi:hypothetical protein C1X59_29660 [Pseudomonas sp. FW215-R2]|nr:hypothetical protein C1X59_29660 [Pseudomonas sp. FW215-R2]PMX09709.1 hypothetical protein C1X60_12205 [Pseudomonas sp. FW215-L1]PMX22835.1 hypothetical protein C1X57_12595 [Pseudomonas sp. FW215-E1]PNA29687.1 hypothetical protein C1X58_12910 [Pseudomonas sp. FW215-R4]
MGRRRCGIWRGCGFPYELKKPPHPNPLPEGEGTDWGIFTKYTDLKLLYRIHNRLDLSGRRTAQDNSVGSLSLRERAGVRERF